MTEGAMTAGQIGLAGINLDIDAFAERIPFETFDLLRREAPVYWYEWKGGKPFWCITRFNDVVYVSKEWRIFSSETGGTSMEDIDAERYPARKSMLDMDPPAHTRLRAIVNRDFTPRALAQYEDLLHYLSRAIIDRAARRQEFDFIDEIAAVLPIRVLARILGVPEEDTDKLIDWSDRMIGNTDPDFADVLQDSPESDRYQDLPFRSPAALEVFEYGHWLAELRRRDPSDDIVSKMVHADLDGDRLTPLEFDPMFLLLVVAGNETTRQAIAHAMRAFVENPDQMADLRGDPALMRTAVEEIIRWATPVMHFRRTATADVEMHGTRIKAGDKVVIWYISANRDETVFPDPYRFDIRRHPNDNVSFGRGGPHSCLGASLARMEIRIMFEELLPRIRNVELLGAPVRMRSNFTNAYKRMPVRVSWT